MEYVEGTDFSRYLKNHKSKFFQDENLMKNIYFGILDGLFDIHQKRIIHRDLKPANIFITHDNKVKLLDFGLAKMLDYSTITTRGKLVGTPLFMSPEIIEGKTIDYRSDLYSFGVILYHIYTDQYPFSGENIFVLLNNIVTKPPKRVSDNFSMISNQMENIILKLLEKQPYLRPFRDALELKNVINEIPLIKTTLSIEKEVDKSFKKKKFFVRLLHTEKTEFSNFIEVGGKVDGIEYPANYLPMYTNQIKDLKDFNTPYYFDPSTNRLAYSSFSSTKGLTELPYVYDKFNKITPKDLSSLSEIKKYVKDTLDWQIKWETSFLTSPFHYSKSLTDDWLATDLKLLEEALEYRDKNNNKKQIYAGVCMAIEELTDKESRLELINKYSRTLPDGFIFYINDIEEKSANPSQLYSFIDLLLKFKELKRPVIAARVGTLGLGLLELGVDAFSQGIASLTGFSENTLLSNRQYGYDMERKYYLQHLLLTLKAQIASEILENFPEFRCNCRFCNAAYEYNMLARSAKAHFLEIRHNELDRINGQKLDFLKMAITAKKNISRVKQKINLPSSTHIATWIEVFTEFQKG